MTDASALRDALAQLRNARGEVVPIETDDDGNRVSALAATGRLVVAPGQTIASAWGNTVADQTTQVFLNAADRDSQWVSPKEGSRCYLQDVHAAYIRRAAAWTLDSPQFVQSWQQLITVSSGGGVGPIPYYYGAFKAATLPQIYITNGDLGVAWAMAAIYYPGTTNAQFSFNPYSLNGSLLPNSPIRANILAIGEWP